MSLYNILSGIYEINELLHNIQIFRVSLVNKYKFKLINRKIINDANSCKQLIFSWNQFGLVQELWNEFSSAIKQLWWCHHQTVMSLASSVRVSYSERATEEHAQVEKTSSVWKHKACFYIWLGCECLQHVCFLNLLAFCIFACVFFSWALSIKKQKCSYSLQKKLGCFNSTLGQTKF